MSLTFEHHADEQRFLAHQDGTEVGTVRYRLNGTVLTVTSTVTDPERRGQGIAGELTRTVLEEARGQGWSVVPQCPYTQRFIDQNPEYAGLLSEGTD